MPKPPVVLPLRRDVERVAAKAKIPDNDREQFCDYVCETVELIRKLDRRAVSSKPGDALVHAARAARALNEAVCSLKTPDRDWVNVIADKHPALAQETRISGITTELFQTNELNQTVWLLATLFNFAVNQASPAVPGKVGEPGRKSKKSGIGRDMMFEFLLGRLLTATAEAHGRLSFNKNSGKGTFVQALDILRKLLPRGVIPAALNFSAIQQIKTKHVKYRRRWLNERT
jgi:hypothetical protein